MAGTKTKKGAAIQEEDFEEEKTKRVVPARTIPLKATPITPEEFIGNLNNAVSNVTAIFQLREQLLAEVGLLKEELAIGREMKLEKAKLESLKREQDEFLYEFQINQSRLERELKEKEEEHKVCLKAEADAQVLKLKLDREEQTRLLKREREDWEREKAQLALEKESFAKQQKAFESERTALRAKLTEELNRDNAHAVELLKLNHQKDIEVLNGELRLEKANFQKFEIMLKEAREQIEKLSNQLTVLSKDALASASTASVASKLKDIIGQLPLGQTRVS